MDHEVVPRHCKFCDWLFNLSRDHFSLHQGKYIRVTMEFEVPKRHIFKAYIIHWHGSTGFCSGRGKRGALIQKGKGPWQRNIVIIIYKWNYFGGRENENKRRQKNGQTWLFFSFSFQNCLFWAYMKKINTFTFWCMVIPLGPHLVYT